MTYTRRVQPRHLNDLDAAQVPALIEQTQDLAEPRVGNLNPGLAPERDPICGWHCCIKLTVKEMFVKICLIKIMSNTIF